MSETREAYEITDELIGDVTRKIEEGEEIRIKLKGGGILHFDRPLPFLVVFRHPPGRKDRALSLLARSQASFLVAPADMNTKAADACKSNCKN